MVGLPRKRKCGKIGDRGSYCFIKISDKTLAEDKNNPRTQHEKRGISFPRQRWQFEFWVLSPSGEGGSLVQDHHYGNVRDILQEPPYSLLSKPWVPVILSLESSKPLGGNPSRVEPLWLVVGCNLRYSHFGLIISIISSYLLVKFHVVGHLRQYLSGWNHWTQHTFVASCFFPGDSAT